MGDLNSERYTEPMNILQKSGLIIINYKYKEEKTYTTEYRNKKKDIDYFLVNNVIYENSKIKKFKTYNTKEFKKISDHYPILFEIDIK